MALTIQEAVDRFGLERVLEEVPHSMKPKQIIELNTRLANGDDPLTILLDIEQRIAASKGDGS